MINGQFLTSESYSITWRGSFDDNIFKNFLIHPDNTCFLDFFINFNSKCNIFHSKFYNRYKINLPGQAVNLILPVNPFTGKKIQKPNHM